MTLPENGRKLGRRSLPLLDFTCLRENVWTDEDGFFFQFIEAKSGSRPYERYGAGLNHLGFPAQNVEQIEHIRQAMTLAGFKMPEIQNLSGASALFLADPDGLRFEITYYPPGASVID